MSATINDLIKGYQFNVELELSHIQGHEHVCWASFPLQCQLKPLSDKAESKEGSEIAYLCVDDSLSDD